MTVSLEDEPLLYTWLTAVYVASRSVLALLGIRFLYDYDWQHFHDLALLKTRLFESLLYTHAFPIPMNVLVGGVERISHAHAGPIYQALFLATGWLFTLSVAYLARALGASPRLAFGVATLFCLSPAFLYFESFLHYEFPGAAMLAISAALFHRGVVTGGLTVWAGFFLTCAALVWFRLTFHLVWLLSLLGLALVFEVQHLRRILLAASLPVLLVVALYAKNQVIFGFFGPSSRSGFSLALVTTQQLEKNERQTWVRQGKIHPVALLSVYSGADKYGKLVKLPAPRGIAVLDQVRRANGQVNYNHAGLIEVSKLLMRGGEYYIAHRPRQYLHTVRRGVRDYFNPTTRWHPHDPKGSPHRAHRAILGSWERMYNHVWHGLFFPPYGLYLLLVPAMVVAVWSAVRSLFRSRLREHAADKLVLVLALSSVYVPLLSCLVAIGELERYRFLVEAPMWLLAMRGVSLSLSRVLRVQIDPDPA